MTYLNYLNAALTKIDDKVLETVMRRCPNLQYLQIQGCKNLTSEGLLKSLINCHQLRHINLNDTATNNEVLWKLGSLSTLCGIECKGAQIDDNGLEMFLDLILETEAVPQTRQIHLLNLDLCTKVTVQSLSRLAIQQGWSLYTINLSNIPTIKEAIPVFAQYCTRLEVMNLTDTNVDDETLKSLYKTTSLTILNLTGIPLTHSYESMADLIRRLPYLTKLNTSRLGLNDIQLLQLTTLNTKLKLIVN